MKHNTINLQNDELEDVEFSIKYKKRLDEIEVYFDGQPLHFVEMLSSFMHTAYEQKEMFRRESLAAISILSAAKYMEEVLANSKNSKKKKNEEAYNHH